MSTVHGARSTYLSDVRAQASRKLKTTAKMLSAVLGFACGALLDVSFFKDFSAPLRITAVLVVGGIATTFILLLYRAAHAYYLRSQQYLHGDQGELLVLEELKKLPEHFHIFPDISLPGKKANIDFVAVGPNGIFVIEVKNHNARVAFDGRQLTNHGRWFERDFLAQACSEAEGLGDYLNIALMGRAQLISVIVFSNAKAWVAPNLRPFGITVTHVRMLLRFITATPRIELFNVDTAVKALVPLNLPPP